MKPFKVLLAALAAAVLTGQAGAVPPGFELEFDGDEEGLVIFSGAIHSGEGMYCTDCHMSKFDVSRAAEISWADHRRDQYCFSCHNGEIAFAPRRNCTNCHQADPDQG